MMLNLFKIYIKKLGTKKNRANREFLLNSEVEKNELEKDTKIQEFIKETPSLNMVSRSKVEKVLYERDVLNRKVIILESKLSSAVKRLNFKRDKDNAQDKTNNDEAYKKEITLLQVKLSSAERRITIQKKLIDESNHSSKYKVSFEDQYNNRINESTKIQTIPIKSFIKELDGSDYKALYLDALTNGSFLIRIFDIIMWPEGLSFDETPVHEKNFDDFISAYNHLVPFTSDFFEIVNNRNLDPLELINEYLFTHYEKPDESELADIKKTIADDELREKHESDMQSLEYEIHMEDERDSW